MADMAAPRRLTSASILSDAELDKEMPPQVLLPSDPRAPQNCALYSHKLKAFEFDDARRTLVVHLRLQGSLIQKPAGSDQASGFPLATSASENEAPSMLRDQFFYIDRGTETVNARIMHRGVATQPPPSSDHIGTVSQNGILDRYSKTDAIKEDADSSSGSASNAVYSDQMKSSIRLMERIVNLNLDSEAYEDFRFFVDEADKFKEGGSMLPLWRFTSDKAKKKQVTCIKWNPRYSDLFAVGYGSYEFLKQSTGGLVGIFSLKNSKFPDLALATDSTVCSLDWHPLNPALIALGFYDGSVSVFDIRHKSRKLLFQSTVRDVYHSEPVWEVLWVPSPDALSFHSVSVDGRVCLWTIKKSKLACEPISELKSELDLDAPPAALSGLLNGLCFDFSPFEEGTYLVGTEEGFIHRCSRFFAQQPLSVYKAHSMGVYTVRWSPFNASIFASCSADWTIKVWSVASVGAPLCCFDVRNAVGDICWSPVSSTILAAATADGRVCVYDISVNRYKAVHSQKVVGKGQLTKISFNASEPVILVGDDKGTVSCLKLSPNLSKAESGKVAEADKLNKVIHILSG